MQEEIIQKEHINRLMNAIASCGMNLKELSKAANIPYPSLRDYAKGKKKPGLDAFASIIEACGVSSDWVLFGKKEIEIDPQSFGKILSLVEDKYLHGGYRAKPKGSELLSELIPKITDAATKNEEILNLPAMKKYREILLLDSFDKGMIAALIYNELGNINMDDENYISKANSIIQFSMSLLEEKGIADKTKHYRLKTLIENTPIKNT